VEGQPQVGATREYATLKVPTQVRQTEVEVQAKHGETQADRI